MKINTKMEFALSDIYIYTVYVEIAMSISDCESKPSHKPWGVDIPCYKGSVDFRGSTSSRCPGFDSQPYECAFRR